VSITKSKAVTLGSATLTGSAAVVGDVFDVRNNTTVSLRLSYTKTTGTLMVVSVEGTLVKDVWTSAVKVPIALDTSGTISGAAITIPLAGASYSLDTTGVYHLPVDVAGMHQIRVKAHETGTPGGTLAVAASAVQGGDS
jgi:hypothetical protein